MSIPILPEEYPAKVEVVDEVEEVSLGNNRVVKIGKSTMGDQAEKLKQLLKDNVDVFAFYMSFLPPNPLNRKGEL